MELILSILGSAVAIAGLQFTIMTKVVELNSRITRLESQTTEIVYMNRQQTSILQRVAHIEAVVDRNNLISSQIKRNQEQEE